MKSVLICGGAGYIGSHMVRLLKAHGLQPVVLDNFSSGHEQALAPDVKVIRCDLLDAEGLRAAFAEHDFAAVMHFAGLIIVPESVKEPGRYYSNNVLGTLNLLEAMREAGVNRFVFSSTAAVYGDPETDTLAEDHPLRPLSPYGRSKLMIEQALADYAKAYDFSSVCFRYFNAAGADPSGEIGEAHSPETHLIPNILRAALGTGPKLTLFGDDYDTPDGTCIRDYIHILDLCDAHLRALDYMRLQPGAHVLNLGNGGGFSVREALDAAGEVVGRAIPFAMAPRRPGDASKLVANSSKARAALDWTPAYPDIREIIETAWRWHKDQKY